MPTRCILLILLQEKGRKKKRYDDSKNFFFTKYVFTLTIREQIRNPLWKTILIGHCESFLQQAALFRIRSLVCSQNARWRVAACQICARIWWPAITAAIRPSRWSTRPRIICDGASTRCWQYPVAASVPITGTDRQLGGDVHGDILSRI